MLVMYAFPRGKPILQTFRLVGPEVSTMDQIKDLIKVGHPSWFTVLETHTAMTSQRAEAYARNVWTGLEVKLKDEEARRGVKAREKFYGRLR